MTIAEAAAKFPALFALRGHEGTFRISLQSSYLSEGRVVLYTEKQSDHPGGEWQDFAKGSPEELAREVIPLIACPTCRPDAASPCGEMLVEGICPGCGTNTNPPVAPLPEAPPCAVCGKAYAAHVEPDEACPGKGPDGGTYVSPEVAAVYRAEAAANVAAKRAASEPTPHGLAVAAAASKLHKAQARVRNAKDKLAAAEHHLDAAQREYDAVARVRTEVGQ